MYYTRQKTRIKRASDCPKTDAPLALAVITQVLGCSLNKKVRMQTNFQKYKLSSNVQMYHIGPRLVQPAAQFLAYPF
jgi:hypothetical protein